MSDVEKITHDNHNRYRNREAAKAWERRAAEAERAKNKQMNIKSWLFFLTYVTYSIFGASVSLTAVFAIINDFGRMATTASAAFASIICGLILADRIER